MQQQHQAAAPAFLLGALAAFIAILVARLNRIVDRTVVLNGIPEDDVVRYRLKADLPRLMRRAAMMNRAIFWAVVASIALTLLVIVAFVTALLQIQHEHGVAIFFLISLGAFDSKRSWRPWVFEPVTPGKRNPLWRRCHRIP